MREGDEPMTDEDAILLVIRFERALYAHIQDGYDAAADIAYGRAIHDLMRALTWREPSRAVICRIAESPIDEEAEVTDRATTELLPPAQTRLALEAERAKVKTLRKAMEAIRMIDLSPQANYSPQESISRITRDALEATR